NDRADVPRGETGPARQIAVFAILIQLSLIYYLNALHKTGWTWRQGSAVHYVVFQERMVTWFGLFMRPYLQPWMTMRMTYTTWNIELLAPLIILNPIFFTWTRRVAMVLLPGLHVAFAAVLTLGQFSFNMIGFFPLLLGPRDWRLFARWFGPSEKRARTVMIDEGAPAAIAWARLLARLDLFHRLEFAPLDASPGGKHRPTWARINPPTGDRMTGARALADCLAAPRCALPAALLLRIGPARMLVDALRGPSERALGQLAAARATSRYRPPSPARRWLSRRLAAVREV